MTYDDVMFTNFTPLKIELPYSCLNSMNYVCPQMQKHVKVSTKMREIGKDFQDVVGLRLCDKVVNFA